MLSLAVYGLFISTVTSAGFLLCLFQETHEMVASGLPITSAYDPVGLYTIVLHCLLVLGWVASSAFQIAEWNRVIRNTSIRERRLLPESIFTMSLRSLMSAFLTTYFIACAMMSLRGTLRLRLHPRIRKFLLLNSYSNTHEHELADLSGQAQS